MRRSSKPKTYFIGNFVLGMRRDGALTQEQPRDEEAGETPYILHSLKTLENYDINFVDGSIYPRAGYERFNPDVLPVENGGVEQIFYHTNLRRDRDDIFVVANERWYRVMPTEGSPHEMLIDAAVTVDNGYKKPMIVWGDRIFFATDDGWYWTDEDRVYDGTKYYQAGIDKPSAPLDMTPLPAPGQKNPTEGHFIPLTRVDKRKIAFQYTPAIRHFGNTVAVYMRCYPDSQYISIGSVRLKIYTDNDGEPSDELVSDRAFSEWRDSTSLPVGEFAYRNFFFTTEFELAPGEKVWFDLEADDAYFNNYVEDTIYICVGNYNGGSPTYGESMVYDTSGDDFWDTVNDSEVAFYFSGPTTDRIYEYVCTFYNSTYGIESRPSASFRGLIDSTNQIMWIGGHPTVSDDQVDKVRIYRRALDEGLEITALDSEITSTYQWLADLDVLGQMYDTKNDLYLGADLQTQDHYKITEADDTDDDRRGAVVPAGACIWKGRIWVFEAQSNILYFSKKLEEDGATGQTGKPVPDYFPLTNKLEIQEEAAFLAIRPLANDQMAIYFRNGPVYVLWGMDEVLNPPVDFSYRPMVYNIGLTSSWGVCDFRGEHIYLSRHGLYAYSGGPIPRYLSQNIQSILNDINDDNLAKSVLVARGEEIWLLIDEDDDGYKDTIYILDLQKSIASWRRHSYGVNISDLFVKALSSSSRDVIAIDNSNYYVMELETGTTDNGKPITSFLETHKNDVDMAFIHGVRVSGFYADGDVPSSYDILITDHTGYGTRIQLNPASSMDDRGHYSGVRIKTYGAFELEMEQLSVKPTNLRKIILEYNEKGN